MLVVMDKTIHEEHLSQPLQTNNKQFKIAVIFVTGFNGIFNVTSKSDKFYFAKSYSNEDGFIQILILKGAYELESSNIEINRIIIEEEHCTEANYPFTNNSNFSTLGSFIELSSQRPIFSFLPDDSILDLKPLVASTIYG